MSLSKETREKVVSGVRLSSGDTGSTPVQVAQLTERIRMLTEHLKTHKQDYSTKRGLLKLISQRMKLLKYLERTDRAGYRNVLTKLQLKK